jgi:hypothetical protein
MTQFRYSRRAIALSVACATVTAAAACGARQSDADASAAGGVSAEANKLPLAAKLALDSGNAAYRAKQLDVALSNFREATVAAPQHAAPWFGIYMVANEMKNASLADSAMARVRELSGDKTALDAHAQVTAAPPELLPPPSSTTLPSGHPKSDVAPSAHPKYKLVSPEKIDSVKRTRM